MIELGPAAQQLAMLVTGVNDRQLSGSTPCPRYAVGDLIDHVNGLSIGLRHAAQKTPAPGGGVPSGDAGRLGEDWRDRIPVQLAQLADAWNDAAAWQGMTAAGGLDLPGEIVGLVTLDELVVHGWDIARSTGQQFAIDDHLVAACIEFASMTAADRTPDAGPFGPVVEVPEDATALDHLLGLTGRDPSWAPS